MKTSTMLAATVALFAGMFASSLYENQTARGQDARGGGGTRVRSSAITFPGPPTLPGVSAFTSRSRRSALSNAVRKLANAKDAAAKEKAQKSLNEMLTKYFDADLQLREQEISNIEARVKELRDVLAKRRAARSAIVDLQLKVLINESEGLGFPSGRASVDPYLSRGGFSARFGSPGTTNGGNPITSRRR